MQEERSNVLDNEGVQRTPRHDNHDSDEIMNTIVDSDSAYGIEGANPGYVQNRDRIAQISYNSSPLLLARDSAVGLQLQQEQGQDASHNISSILHTQNQNRTRSLPASYTSRQIDQQFQCDTRQDSVSEVQGARQISSVFQYQQIQLQNALNLSSDMDVRSSNSLDLYRFYSAPMQNFDVEIRDKTVIKRDSASDLNNLLDDARQVSQQDDMLVAARQLLASPEIVPNDSNILSSYDDNEVTLGIAVEPELVAETATLRPRPLEQISQSGRIILDSMDSPRTKETTSGGQEHNQSSRVLLSAIDSPRASPSRAVASSSVSQLRAVHSYDSDEQYEDTL
eukprot:TRINITY_DN1869_c2_g1_i3.p1 TRINITY_DN1869_c2_g1~~TRINITY_DN1869_c2_g1_i3.p1  ORF type:complete len:357 (-),score=23.67 TRINITY_DN1869_c2_g1_i3:332-1345(-)